ncbi:thiamine-phosphate kinase [Brevibacterium samyangense]|uniref:thiamine-phosphate kinase n=1 Tax=Brevibacterium samyangense TaxID=366888 RepID=UPI0031D130C2
MTTLGELGEHGVLERILAVLRRAGTDPRVRVGPGDDAAVTAHSGDLVTTTDMLLEGHDFLTAWLDPHRLGIKAAAQNLADVCAMGAVPESLVVSLAAPDDTPVDVLTGIMGGLAEEAARAGATVTGGDLSGGPCLIVSVTALGSLPAGRAPVLRSGARPGDAIVLAGTVGRAAAGLDLLFDAVERGGARPRQTIAEAVAGSAGSAPGTAALVETQRAPRPRYAASAALAEVATSMIDVSDGLLGDLGRIARASGVRADLDPEALTALAEDLLPAAAALGRPAHAAVDWVLTGGEDHGFLATVPAGTAEASGAAGATGGTSVPWVRIGTVLAAADGEEHAGVGAVAVGGREARGEAFAHFGGSRSTGGAEGHVRTTTQHSTTVRTAGSTGEGE